MNWFSIGSNNGLSHIRRQAITWTIADLLYTRPKGTNLSEIWIKIQNFSLTKMHLNILSAKWRPFRPRRAAGHSIGPSVSKHSTSEPNNRPPTNRSPKNMVPCSYTRKNFNVASSDDIFEGFFLFSRQFIHCQIYRNWYRQISNISRTKSQNLNVSRLVLELSLPNPLKPGVNNEDVVGAAPSGNASATSEWSTTLLPTCVCLILEILW